MFFGFISQLRIFSVRQEAQGSSPTLEWIVHIVLIWKKPEMSHYLKRVKEPRAEAEGSMWKSPAVIIWMYLCQALCRPSYIFHNNFWFLIARYIRSNTINRLSLYWIVRWSVIIQFSAENKPVNSNDNTNYVISERVMKFSERQLNYYY